MIDGSHLRQAGALCRATLARAPRDGATWETPARDLEWSCRETLAHILAALSYYAVNLASRSTVNRASGGADPRVPIESLLDGLEGRATVLAHVVDSSPPDARGSHPDGMADPAGFAAMGCDEMLVHTFDVAGALGIDFAPGAELCVAVMARLFPWAPEGEEPWPALLWCNGRAPLGDRARQDRGWSWWPRPLAEWDGAPRTA